MNVILNYYRYAQTTSQKLSEHVCIYVGRHRYEFPMHVSLAVVFMSPLVKTERIEALPIPMAYTVLSDATMEGENRTLYMVLLTLIFYGMFVRGESHHTICVSLYNKHTYAYALDRQTGY